MRKTRALLLIYFIALSTIAAECKQKTTDELAAVLTSQTASRRARMKAVKLLAQKPPGEVLPKLRAIKKEYGEYTAGWGSDLFKMGVKISWQAAASSTASYAWSDTLQNPAYSDAEKRNALLGVLRHEESAIDKAFILQDLQLYWANEVETEALTILRDPKAGLLARYLVSETLLKTTDMKYFADIYGIAADAPVEVNLGYPQGNWPARHWYARTLMSKKSPAWKSRVTRNAIDTIHAERQAHPNDPYSGYFIATTLEHYADAKFKPDQSDPKYHGSSTGLTDAFYRDTVDNAMKWWDANKELYSQQ